MDPNGGQSWGPMFIMYPFHVLNSRAWTGCWSRPEPLVLARPRPRCQTGRVWSYRSWQGSRSWGPGARWSQSAPLPGSPGTRSRAGLSILVDLVRRARQGSNLPGPDSWSLPGPGSWARPGPETPGPRKAGPWSRDLVRARRSKPAGPGMDPGKIMDQGPTYGRVPGPGNPFPGKEGL